MSHGDLVRFQEAQARYYETALKEVRNGKKESHWMWFVFPQIAGLGQSANSRQYAIRDINEARVYLADALLGEHLREVSNATLTHADKTAEAIFGTVDAQKLHASMTLFRAAGEEDVCQKVLDAFFDGQAHQPTLDILQDPNA